MPETNPIPPRRQRLRPRLSLRALMVVVLVLGGWLGWIVHRARVQREVVLAIRMAGGEVDYDYQRPFPLSSRPRTIWAPRWLVDSLGIDYFSSVTWVRYRKTRADMVASTVARFGKLNSVSFNGSDLGDAGLAHLAGLDVKSLFLEGTKVTDAGLETIRGKSSLEDLVLFNTPVGDEGITHIASLPNLQSLNLGKTRVTDAGMEQIEKLRGLKALMLFDTRIGDPTVARLKSLVHLTTVQLRQTRATQSAMEALGRALPGAYIIATPTAPPEPAGSDPGTL